MDEQTAPSELAPESWRNSLESARQDVAAGRTVSAESVHAKFKSRRAIQAAAALPGQGPAAQG
jgi:hypothetical protein